VSAVADPDEFLLTERPGRMSRGELRVDLRPAVVLAVVAAVAGVVVGLVWAQVAPVQQVVLAAGGSVPLGDATDHVFDATAVFVLLVLSYGVVVGSVGWQLRAHRGPVVLIAVVLGALAGSWLAARVGTWTAPGSTPVPVLLDRADVSATRTPGPPVPAQVTTLPATLGTWWALLPGALGAAVAYVLAAIALGEEDLGRCGSAAREH